MQMNAPLDVILKSGTHARVLRALQEVPQGFALSGREIARRAGVSHPAAARVLATLAEQGVVHARHRLRADEFTLNVDHVFAEPIRALFDEERHIPADLRLTLRSELSRLGITSAYLFGSAASGTASAASDIDLAIEPPAHARSASLDADIDLLKERIHRRYGNRLNVIMRDAKAGARMDAIWRRLLRDSTPLFEKAD